VGAMPYFRVMLQYLPKVIKASSRTPSIFFMIFIPMTLRFIFVSKVNLGKEPYYS
jgi:hypothetical protein